MCVKTYAEHSCYSVFSSHHAPVRLIAAPAHDGGTYLERDGQVVLMDIHVHVEREACMYMHVYVYVNVCV